MLAMLVSYLVNDMWSLPSLSRSTGYGLVILPSEEHHRRVDDYEPIPVDLERLESDHVSFTR